MLRNRVCTVFFLFGSIINTIECTAANSKVVQQPEDTKVEELSPQSTNAAALIHGFPAANPLGIGTYPLGFYGQRPWPAGLLLDSLLPNPALRLGYGTIPYNFLFYGGPYYNRDPLIGLILRQYGKYLPYGIGSYGLYGYSVPSTFQPFNANKYEHKL